MNKTLKVLSQDTNGITFADPADPSYTVRFKFSSNRKSIQGNAVENHITEIIVNTNNPVAVCPGDTSCALEAVSVRLRASGSSLSVPTLKKIITDLSSQLDTWTSEDVLVGFRPTTAPIRTTE